MNNSSDNPLTLRKDASLRYLYFTAPSQSMSPAIECGDIVCVDTGDKKITDGVYLFDIAGTHELKRVSVWSDQISISTDYAGIRERLSLAQAKALIVGRAKQVLAVRPL